jgi:hypothetical protein
MAHQTGISPRIGFHYFPDTLHYREKDLHTWLPELRAMGASWVTLLAHPERAIPEPFLTGLIAAGIQPVLQFQLPLPAPTQLPSLELLVDTYARWGVRYAVLFDRPNIRKAWSASAWTQSEIVEQFLDIYTPLAERVLQSGMLPVFPPLQPGGDYWDTTFLQAALRSLQRRGKTTILDHFTLAALAWTNGRPLGWGAGGPERWPLTVPYVSPAGSQDQLGFRAFDWYLPMITAELGAPRPILIVRAGQSPEAHTNRADRQTFADTALDIARLLAAPDGSNDQIPEDVLACNFWLLSAAPESPYLSQAWVQPDGGRLPAATALRHWVEQQAAQPEATPPVPPPVDVVAPAGEAKALPQRLIPHYLLVPLYAWGIAEWDMETIRPIIEKYHPTVGFSVEEACLAERVTIAGGKKAFSEADLQRLRQAGCSLEIVQAGGDLAAL